jgi:hypothetical protein
MYNWADIIMWMGGLALICMMLAIIELDRIDGQLVTGIVVAVIAFLPNFFAFLGMEKPGRDERRRKIGTMATAYSWYITALALCAVVVLCYTFNVALSMPRLFGLTMIVLIASMMGCFVYFSRKGDVE